MAQGHKRAAVKIAGCWVRFPPKEIKYLIILFLCACNKTKCCFEFRYLTCSRLNTSRIHSPLSKEENGNFLTLPSLARLGIQHEANEYLQKCLIFNMISKFKED